MTPTSAEAGVVDGEERARIERTALDRTLFVEAGAGTGKTRELVERITHLVLDEGVPLAEVAAITFTEAAAAELRDRIREAFERRLAAAPPADVRAACERALADADVAAIATLHAFALRILGEHPVEVGLPPQVEVLDEVSSQLAFERRWEVFVEGLHTDPAVEELVLRAFVLGIPLTPRGPGTASLKDVAAIFGDNWDRVDSLATETFPPLAPVDFAPLERAVGALDGLAERCRHPGDKLVVRLCALVPEAEAALAEPDRLQRLELVVRYSRGWKASGLGAKGSWDDVVAARTLVDAVGTAAAELRQRTTDEVVRRLSARLAAFTRDGAEARRAEGRLEYHDLLVLARRLVRGSATARAELHRRYTRLLLDEVQDTDPIQIEVAVLIAAAHDHRLLDDGPTAHPWTEARAQEGRLFFVGDPKQSIYRFRRADIGVYLEARRAFAGTEPARLRQNFRTVEPVLDWVNHVFTALMPVEIEGTQPRYEALVAHRRHPPGDHRVVLLGGPVDEDVRAPELRRLEAGAVADTLAAIRQDPSAWPVLDTATNDWRPARMADVTVLLPTRTSLRALEEALDEAAVPYRVDTGTLVYDTQEVREVLAALRAVDDPGDAIALVAALRSPLYACSDVDLFAYHHAGGRWDLRVPPPDSVGPEHPVVRALAHLRALRAERWWSEPSALLDRLLRDRQAFALAFGHRRPREVWRRLRFLVDQARLFEEVGGGGLRSFLAWAELQRNEGSRAHEPLLAETDDDAVSILTIHGAKGLEFPITVVAGTTTKLGAARRGVEVLWQGERPEVRLNRQAATANFDRLADLESEMDTHERQRLLYVACTRARDHLIVCTHHKPGTECYGAWLARLSADVEATLCRRLPERVPVPPVDPLSLQVVRPPGGPEAWRVARQALLAGQRLARFTSAAVAREGQDGRGAREVEVDRTESDGVEGGEVEAGRGGRAGAIPWRRGRAGTAVGRAVHATLQLVDLATGERLDELAAQQAHLEALPGVASTVAAMARSALRAPSVRAALRSPRWWRELYVAAPVGDRAVEGYVDLLYETAAGLVVVDYKTDTVARADDVEAAVARYALQTAAYALALEASTGLPVVGARLVFCTTGAAIERPVPDLTLACAEVRRRLGA